jgi:IgA Peptidase M64
LKNYLFAFFIIVCISFSCNKEKVFTVDEQSVPKNFKLKSFDPQLNNYLADKINIIVLGKGYKDTSEFIITARRDLALNGQEIVDTNTFDKVLFGLFAIEPFKNNISKFNIWYYSEQITGDVSFFIQSQKDKINSNEKDFGLKHATYLVFNNPLAEVSSFAYPSNIQPNQMLIKDRILFGSATVARYADLGDGMAVLAHELGHSIFNLRDEYLRTDPILPDKYGFNIAATLEDAKNLWGSTENKIDPFYYTWKEKRKKAGYWIDIQAPQKIGVDKDTNETIYTWNASEADLKVGFYKGGGVTSTGISWRPTVTSLMNNEDAFAKSWPLFPPVFGSANRKVIEDILNLYSGK